VRFPWWMWFGMRCRVNREGVLWGVWGHSWIAEKSD
jgi:hypothetical protein